MPQIKSSIRSVKTDAERNARNAALKSSVRTLMKKVEQSAKNGAKTEAVSLLTKTSSALDKAANKGVIHKNAAARHKARLSAKVNALAE